MITPEKPQHVQLPSLYVTKCVLRSSVVLQAVYGRFRSPSTLDLVFGKETALELAVVSEHGVVQSVCEQPVFGSIKDLRVLPWNGDFRGAQPELHGKDLLVLLSDSGKLSFLTFSMGVHRFQGVSHTHLASLGKSCKGLDHLLAVEPRGRAVAVSGLEDRVAVFPTSRAAGNNVVEKRLDFPGYTRSSASEAGIIGTREKCGGRGTIWSMAFSESSQECNKNNKEALILVVLIHWSGAKACNLLVLNCDTQERLVHLLATYDPALEIPGHLALNIIEFPVLPGYLLVGRSGDLLLLDLRSPSTPCASRIVSGQQQSFAEKSYLVEDGEGPDTLAASALLELCSRGGDSPERRSICAWSWQPENGQQSKLVLGMDNGEVAIAYVSINNSDVVQIEIRKSLYQCSPCRALLWLHGGFIAALIEMGDGQILEVLDGGLMFRSYIQNISPIVDFALVDYHDEKQDQMFACCGIGQEGSIRVIRSGISVERLLSTPPVYQGVTGMWTLRMFHKEDYHSFFVMSFVEETRVLSVGLNFVDISDSVGFEPSASTLTCGLIEEGWVAQVCSKEVLLCAPTRKAHPAGVASPSPLQVHWKPQRAYVSLGAISKGTVILALSRPGVLLILRTTMTHVNAFELVETQRCQLDAEVSCISIPREEESIFTYQPPPVLGLVEGCRSIPQLCGIEIGKVCVVGTHKPSVEVLSIEQGEDCKPLAVGLVSLVNSFGTVMGGCVPENVRLALFDRLYILCGLRNGMLLRYEWPSIYRRASTSPPKVSLKAVNPSLSSPISKSSIAAVDIEKQKQSVWIDYHGANGWNGSDVSSSVYLHLVDVRRIGVSPVSFIPLRSSLRADMIALSDRPWLLQTSRNSQRIAYRSISFQPSTHGTPVRSPECPNGVLFVADCSLHLVEMEHFKRLNVQKLPMSKSPRHVLYHPESKMLLVMRSDPVGSDICCVDPLTGSLQNCFQLDEGEIGRCMQLWYHRGERLLLVGTSLNASKPVMPNGEPECSKGRLLIFRLQARLALGKNKSRLRSACELSAVGNNPFAGDQEIYSSGAGTKKSGVIGESAAPRDASQDEHKIADSESWALSLVNQTGLSGVILAVSAYLGQYVLASAGNNLLCLGFTHDCSQRLRRCASIKTRFVITSIAVHLNRIAVGDCRDGVLFYSYREDTQIFEHLYCDPVQRLVADCVLVDADTAAVTDRHGNFCILSSANIAHESASPEHNLATSCWYHMGETIMHITKGSFAYRAPVEETLKVSSVGSLPEDLLDASLVASTLLGSVFIFIQITREEYDLLEALQIRLALHPMTSPLLGNNHAQYRGQGCPAGVLQVLDGDMLGQFLELTNAQQQMILAGDNATDPIQSGMLRLLGGNFPLEQVLGLFERIHNYLT